MQRTAMKKLKEWKTKRNRKPLILKGARQVWKTWLMKQFGADCFKNVAYINFDSDVRMRQIFEDDYDAYGYMAYDEDYTHCIQFKYTQENLIEMMIWAL